MTQSQFESSLAESLADVGFLNSAGKPVGRGDVKDILDILGGEIENALTQSLPSVRQMSQGQKAPSLTVRGIGKFAVRFRNARPKRMGRNPATGEAVEIAAKPASQKLVLTPVRQLKESIEG